MNHAKLYDHRGELVAPSKRESLVWGVLFVLSSACVLLAIELINTPSKSKAGELTLTAAASSSQSTGTDYNDAPVTPVTSRKFQSALGYAIQQWSTALGEKVKRPELLYGSTNMCRGDEAIACADVKQYRVFLRYNQVQGSFDWDTIMMHEVGHLLGVPHIDGDPLMHFAYSGKIERPTGFASAIAKEYRRSLANGKK